jgi:hypothetical protein
VPEGEQPQERDQRRGRPAAGEQLAHPTVAQHVHLINAVRAGDHPATNAGTLHAALADPHRTGVNRSANLRRCANDTTGVNHHTTLGSGRRKQQTHPTAYEKLSFNGCSFARMNVALDKPHSPAQRSIRPLRPATATNYVVDPG